MQDLLTTCRPAQITNSLGGADSTCHNVDCQSALCKCFNYQTMASRDQCEPGLHPASGRRDERRQVVGFSQA